MPKGRRRSQSNLSFIVKDSDFSWPDTEKNSRRRDGHVKASQLSKIVIDGENIDK